MVILLRSTFVEGKMTVLLVVIKKNKKDFCAAEPFPSVTETPWSAHSICMMCAQTSTEHV